MLMFLIPFTNKNDHVHKRARKFNTQGPKINGNLEGINSTNIYMYSLLMIKLEKEPISDLKNCSTNMIKAFYLLISLQ